MVVTLVDTDCVSFKLYLMAIPIGTRPPLWQLLMDSPLGEAKKTCYNDDLCGRVGTCI